MEIFQVGAITELNSLNSYLQKFTFLLGILA